jgi:hypothetical protein
VSGDLLPGIQPVAPRRGTADWLRSWQAAHTKLQKSCPPSYLRGMAATTATISGDIRRHRPFRSFAPFNCGVMSKSCRRKRRNFE